MVPLDTIRDPEIVASASKRLISSEASAGVGRYTVDI